jgi:hypothetical protein
MTEPKTTRRSSPRRTNDSTDGHLSGQEMRGRLSEADQREALDAADKVGTLWRELCQNEPLMVELLLPEKLRVALGELAKATAS